MRRTRATLALLLLLAGCAAANPNQTMMLTEDTALISVTGNQRQPRQALIDASLREAARFSSGRGFPYFTVIGTADASRTVTRTVRGQTIPNQNIPGDSSSFASTNLSSTYVPGATYTLPDRRVEETRPGIDITIRMFRRGDVDPATDGVYSTEALLPEYGGERRYGTGTSM